ncbi:hypothetical protein BJ508DRAFT_339853 [Ascobolus immersus RN42]|uniref:Uncharacterized protein n=1 Tax=Ascobolus immersus RN42 TaxID=1160509 RepID=A0A3N4IK61_ASCIM|nr:hypothetical protein BJ508DRAFT_339853 [Ascobolus immersus RN42]
MSEIQEPQSEGHSQPMVSTSLRANSSEHDSHTVTAVVSVADQLRLFNIRAKAILPKDMYNHLLTILAQGTAQARSEKNDVKIFLRIKLFLEGLAYAYCSVERGELLKLYLSLLPPSVLSKMEALEISSGIASSGVYDFEEVGRLADRHPVW